MTNKNRQIKKRLKIFNLAKKLSNVSEACRKTGISRTQFYEYKKRYTLKGLEGLANLPTTHKSHPFTTSSELKDQIIKYAIEHPIHGCHRISRDLKPGGVKLSGVTTQKLLNSNNLGTKLQRLRAIERNFVEREIQVTEEQAKAVESYNPCFKERDVETKLPGELLCQDYFYLGYLKGVGKIYFQVVIDTYCSFVFGYVNSDEGPVVVGDDLYWVVIKQYRAWGIRIRSILTDIDKVYGSRKMDFYKWCLEANGIKHIKKGLKCTKENGFLQRFQKSFYDGFLREAKKMNLYNEIDLLMNKLDQWLYKYNYETPLSGYRNMGNTPFSLIKKHINPGNRNYAHEMYSDKVLGLVRHYCMLYEFKYAGLPEENE